MILRRGQADENVMHDPQQRARFHGAVQPPSLNEEEWADRCFLHGTHLFDVIDSMSAAVIAKVHHHRVKAIQLAIDYPISAACRRGKPQIVGEGEAVSADWLCRRPLRGMLEALQAELDTLLRFSCFEFGSVTLIVIGGRVVRVIPAPSIKRKMDELAVLAKFFEPLNSGPR
jgi:hypothetical protein